VVRVALATMLSAFITVSLLWVMQYLIATGVDAFTEDRTFRFLDFVRVQRDERVQTRDDRVERPMEAEAPPPMQLERQLDDTDSDPGAGTRTIGISAPRMSHDVSLGRDGFYSDGEYMPIVQVAPQYPRRAMDRGLEGFVLLEFTVTRDGTVRDPRVIESSSTLFERAAIDAVMRFRYRPRVIDGEPVEVPGVKFRMVFELRDG
jgi:periplasmic protein TonB